MSKYLKPDCELGYIEDNAEIDYLKFNNLRHTILGCMLGDFDNQGSYIVDPEIVKELISMPKYIKETVDNIEICLSELKLDKQISFMVTYEEDRATLTLIEKLSYEANFKLNSGTYSNINEYVLDVVHTSGQINRNVLYSRWNISQYPGNVIDIFSCDDSVLEKYFGIVNRFKYLLVANTVLLEKESEVEELEAEYSNEMFNILKRYPKLESAVLKQVKESIQTKKDFITPEKPNYIKTFNEILDQAISQNANILLDEQKQEFNAEQRNLKNNINIKRSEVVEVKNQATDNQIKPIMLDVRQELLHGSILEIAKNYISAKKSAEEKNKNQSSDQSLISASLNQTNKSKFKENLIKLDLIQQQVVVKAESAKPAEEKKAAEPASAKPAAAASADKPKAKAADKAKASASKPKKAEKKTAKNTKSSGNAVDDEKKKKEEQQKKEAEERKRKEEEARRRHNKRRSAGIGLIAGRVQENNIQQGAYIDQNGRLQFKSNNAIQIGTEKTNVAIKAGNSNLKLSKTAVLTSTVVIEHEVGVTITL